HDEEEHCHRRRRWTDDTMNVPGEGMEADDFSGESITDNKGDFEQVKTLSLTLTSQTLIENTEHSESPVRRRHLCTLLVCMNTSILEAFQRSFIIPVSVIMQLTTFPQTLLSLARQHRIAYTAIMR
ncbi:hypothetical protein PAXRUDRAFT_180825, partial [Paxillus rubicundulus Ve08.2h10]